MDASSQPKEFHAFCWGCEMGHPDGKHLVTQDADFFYRIKKHESEMRLENALRMLRRWEAIAKATGQELS